MSPQVVLLRVGIDSGCGGIQGPLFGDGTFDFVCIPDKKCVSVHTYGNLIGQHGTAYSDYFGPSRQSKMATRHVHVDPEFDTFTYGDPTPPKRSLKKLKRGDLLVFYCGLQRWESQRGWDRNHRPALYLAGYFEVSLAGMANDFDDGTRNAEFGQNFHVRYPSVFEKQKNELVLVKGGPGSRLFQKAHLISAEGTDKAGNVLKVLSPEMQGIFGNLGGCNSIQRSPPRWIDTAFVDRASSYVTGLE